MRQGYLRLDKGLTWCEIDEKRFSAPLRGNIPGIKKSIWKFTKLIVYRCDDCEVISFNYGDKAKTI